MELKNLKRGIFLAIFLLAPRSIPVYIFLFGILYITEGVWNNIFLIFLIYYSWTRVYQIASTTVGLRGVAHDGHISIGKGLISKKYVSSEWSSVSGMEIDDNLLLRIANCSRLKIYFAGASTDTVSFCYLDTNAAHSVRDKFISSSSSCEDNFDTNFNNAEQYKEEDAEDVFSLDGLRLAVVALSSGKFLLVVPFILSISNYFGFANHDSAFPSLLIFGGGFLSTCLKITLVSFSVIVFGVIFFILLYFKWTVRIGPGYVRINYGIFTRREVTVDSGDIQAVCLDRPIMFSAVNSWRLSIQCKSSDRQSRFRLVLPIIGDSDIVPALEKIGLPGISRFADTVADSSLSLKTHFRSIKPLLIVFIFSILLFAYFTLSQSWHIVVLLTFGFSVTLACIWIFLLFSGIRSLFSDKYLLFKSGVFRYRLFLLNPSSVDSWKCLHVKSRSINFHFFLLGWNMLGFKKRVFITRGIATSNNIRDILSDRMLN